MAQRATVSSKQQMTYIVENASILNNETKKSILSLVMMEVGKSVLLDSGAAKEVNIDLDKLNDINAEVVAHIYNIVLARREALGRPVNS